MGTESHETTTTGEDMADQMFAKKGCCFWMPCFGSDRSNAAGEGSPVWWERIRSPDNENLCWRNCNNNSSDGNNNEEKKWWMKGWNAIREWSEIVAGPRWKTFIRRFNKNNKNNKGCGGGGGGVGSNNKGKFQYDPLSYALNFDEGPGQNGHSDEDSLRRDFSSRYASISISAKSSMDLGRDAPSFE